jgi:hypothetical protein
VDDHFEFRGGDSGPTTRVKKERREDREPIG